MSKSYRNNKEALQDFDDSVEFLNLTSQQEFATKNGKTYNGAKYSKRPHRKIKGCKTKFFVDNDEKYDSAD